MMCTFGTKSGGREGGRDGCLWALLQYLLHRTGTLSSRYPGWLKSKKIEVIRPGQRITWHRVMLRCNFFPEPRESRPGQRGAGGSGRAKCDSRCGEGDVPFFSSFKWIVTIQSTGSMEHSR